jgi:glycosyltransferase involved in cell wall biosynthesis
MLSVIIPIYKVEEYYLYRLIRSLEHQKNIDPNLIEYIFILDGGDVLERKAYNRIIGLSRLNHTIINNAQNNGLADSLNMGIEKSKYNFFVRIDSDDYVNDYFISFLIHSIKAAGKDFDGLTLDYVTVDDDENHIDTFSWRNDPIGCAIMFRKSKIVEVGMYKSGLRIHEDKELISRLNSSFRMRHLELPLYRYRMHNNNLTINEKDYEKYRSHIKKP